MKLIVGLGNPGKKYEKTRHNIGFYFIDHWNSVHDFGIWKYENKFKSELIQADYNGENILLCKPQTYMNLSGEAVSSLARFYKIDVNDILVIHDEIDFVVSRVALKFSGSAAGHNGLKSIIEKLGSKDFRRLRIGVGRPAHSSQVIDWVLSTFRPEEKKNLMEKEEEIYNLIEEFFVKHGNSI